MLNMLPSFAVLYIIVTLPKSTEAGCPLSDQIETVNSCPQTAAEWKEAATRKNCKTTSHNCYSLDYHCVINAWMNETIEVCAPKVVIVGMVCAEFNFGGNRIQRNDNATCQKCPTAYNSSVAFKYPECYEYVERSKGLDTSQSNTESSYSSTYAYNKSSEQDDEQLPMGGQFNHTKNESSVAGPEAIDWIKPDGGNCIDYLLCVTSHSSTANKTPRNTRYTCMLSSETSLTRGSKIRGSPFDDR
ncbi:uncharacterized protein LOC128169800 isoform X3 [Crassostrea angulata]|uniref:uncharacterized protein LOC128169800 isoform X3 n=1 Tax=Magallana angulata TaxID=2784310 RepID=UPI0022B0A5B3|nr:uncharacterized protein LOC128169800 isoform X3 [Crassostrea angulata]